MTDTRPTPAEALYTVQTPTGPQYVIAHSHHVVQQPDHKPRILVLVKDGEDIASFEPWDSFERKEL